MKVSEVTQTTPINRMFQIHQLFSRLQDAFDSALFTLQKNSERAKKRAQHATQTLVATNVKSSQAQIIKIVSAIAGGLAPAVTNRSDLSQALYMGGEGFGSGVDKYITSDQQSDQAKQQAADGAKRKISEAEQMVDQYRQRQSETTSRMIQQISAATAPAA